VVSPFAASDDIGFKKEVNAINVIIIADLCFICFIFN